MRALVRVVDHVAHPPLRRDHVERVKDDGRVERVAHGPADHSATNGIEHHGQVQKSECRRDIRDVGNPRLVRRGRREVATHEIRGWRCLGRRASWPRGPAALGDAAEPVLTQQARNALLPDAIAGVAQIREETWRAVGPVGSRMRGSQRDEELDIALVMARRRATTPGVEAAVEMSGSATLTPGFGTLVVPSQIIAQVPAVLRAYTTVDTNAYHFAWKVDGQSVPGNDDADLTQTFALAGSHTVTAYAHAIVGVDTISSTITVLLNLRLFGASPVKKGCPVTFTSSLYGQTGAVTYTWRVGGVATGPNASTWNTTVNWTGTKTVSVDVLDVQGHFASKSMTVTGTTTGTCPFSVSR